MTEATTITRESDLSVIKTGSADPVVAGSTMTYTITATNNGPSNAAQVTATDALPAGVTYLSSSPACIANGGTVTCDLGPVSAGESAVVTIVARISPSQADGSTVTNTAMVSGTVDPKL